MNTTNQIKPIYYFSCLDGSDYGAYLHCQVCHSNVLQRSLEIGCCRLDKTFISIFLIAFLSFSLLRPSPVCYSLFFSSWMMYVKTKLGGFSDFWIQKLNYRTTQRNSENSKLTS